MVSKGVQISGGGGHRLNVASWGGMAYKRSGYASAVLGIVIAPDSPIGWPKNPMLCMISRIRVAVTTVNKATKLTVAT